MVDFWGPFSSKLRTCFPLARTPLSPACHQSLSWGPQLSTGWRWEPYRTIIMHAFKHSPLHLFLGMLCCALLCYAVCCTVGRYVVNWPPLIRPPVPHLRPTSRHQGWYESPTGTVWHLLGDGQNRWIVYSMQSIHARNISNYLHAATSYQLVYWFCGVVGGKTSEENEIGIGP